MATLEVRFAPSQRRLAFCRGGWKRRQINSIELFRQRRYDALNELRRHPGTGSAWGLDL